MSFAQTDPLAVASTAKSVPSDAELWKVSSLRGKRPFLSARNSIAPAPDTAKAMTETHASGTWR